MDFGVLRAVKQRVQLAKESDRDPISVFIETLRLAESALKASVASILAGVSDDQERHRYRHEHTLIRASGIGDWSRVLHQVTTGPAYALLADPFRSAATSLTSRTSASEESWQGRAAEKARQTVEIAGVTSRVNTKTNGLQWAVYITELRNRTVGHGAPTQTKAEQMLETLSDSVEAFIEGFPLFRSEWAYLHRNLSGKYRVIPVTTASSLDYLKSNAQYTYPDGLHIVSDDGRPVQVKLIQTDSDLSDFWFANGAYRENDQTAEWLSYATDNVQRFPASDWVAIPSAFPKSQTDGERALDVQGEVFGNLPPSPDGYVRRPQLESELQARLSRSDWHRMVTLVGAGGTGKTTLTLAVLHEMSLRGDYEAMIWFSSRDIDLTERGPVTVNPRVLRLKDVGHTLHSFLEEEQGGAKVDYEAYLAEQIDTCSLGACLFIFDNFETIDQPAGAYDWLNSRVGPDNKILITTRFRAFKGDYPVEVAGMTRDEFKELVVSLGERLGIANKLRQKRVDKLFEESDGHPYVTKLLLGNIAKGGESEAIIASRDDVLQALFERSLNQVTPLAHRAFLTLCGWRSPVLRSALEAVLTHSVTPGEIPDSSGAIDCLVNYSLVDLIIAADGSEFIRVPGIARAFGQKKLNSSRFEDSIKKDIELLRLFGPVQDHEAASSGQHRIERFLKEVDDRIERQSDLKTFGPLVETIAGSFPAAWLRLARWASRVGDLNYAHHACDRYLETHPNDPEGWAVQADIAKEEEDSVAEAHALIRHSELVTDTQRIFGNIRRVNELASDIRSVLTKDERTELFLKMYHLHSSMSVETLNPTQLSRLAWLAIHAGRSEDARKYAALLEERDPSSPYLSGLKNIY